MNVYMIVADEALSMLPVSERITHVFVFGGVGSIAAAIFLGFLKDHEQKKITRGDVSQEPPRFVVVAPSEADCLVQSARKGEQCLSEGNLRTVMAGLACRGPSPAALKVLLAIASDFFAVTDSVAVEGARTVARGSIEDIPVVCGESSSASMGIMLGAGKNNELRGQLGLNSNSKVMLFSLEGATDPEIYEKLVGVSSQVVFEFQAKFAHE